MQSENWLLFFKVTLSINFLFVKHLKKKIIITYQLSIPTHLRCLIFLPPMKACTGNKEIEAKHQSSLANLPLQI